MFLLIFNNIIAIKSIPTPPPIVCIDDAELPHLKIFSSKFFSPPKYIIYANKDVLQLKNGILYHF